MKKASSVSKPMTKGKSMSSIQPYQQSRVTNRSNDTRKIDSKVSKVSKANSSIKIHQPLSIQNKGSLKQSKLQSSKAQQSELHNSRRKIQSQLQGKKSYTENIVSFRQSENNPHSIKARQLNHEEKQVKVDSRLKVENDSLHKENKELKQKLYRLQQSSLEDKQKIKTLITRISQMKRDTKLTQNSAFAQMSKSKTTASYAHIMKTRGQTDRQNNIQSSNFKNQHQTPFRILQPSASQSKYSKTKQYCGNPQCEQRKKYLQSELYKERIKRDQLQEDKKEWQRNKDALKRQYQDLLYEIQNLRNDSTCQQE